LQGVRQSGALTRNSGSAASLPAESRTRAPGGGLSCSVRGGKAPLLHAVHQFHGAVVLDLQRLEANRPRNLVSIIQIPPNQKTELRKSLILSGLGRSTHLTQYIVRRYDRSQKVDLCVDNGMKTAVAGRNCWLTIKCESSERYCLAGKIKFREQDTP
jgi:hypothetical protein